MRRLLPLTLPSLALTVLGSAVWAATGGPDSAGIEYIDSNEAGGPPHVALDIDDEGTDLGLGDEDTGLVELPFAVDWYGSSETELYVGDNGTAFFAGSQASGSATCPAGGSWSGVAAYWDDLSGGTVRSATLGRYPSRLFVLDWQGFQPGSATGAGQVQVWFLESRDEVVVVHEDLDFGSASHDGGVGAVIGVQGSSSAGLEWSCSGGLSDATSAWFGLPSARAGAEDVELYTVDQSWYGGEDSSQAGERLFAQDINLDGYGDLLVGAPEGDMAWLIWGGAPSTGGGLGGADVRFKGASGDGLGSGLAAADLDGDGLVDLALGEAEGDDAAADAGSVYLLSSASWSGTVTPRTDADGLLTGDASSGKARAGAGLVSPGDVDGDGYDDLLVGAPGDDGAATNAGAVYLWLGGSLSGTSSLSSSATFQAEGAGEGMGAALSGGDVDGDGLADLLIGSDGHDGSATDAGRGYLVLGDSWTGTWDIGAAAEATFDGGAALDQLGEAVLVADVDGDGAPDLLFGAPRDDTAYTDAGALYAFLDGSSWTGSFDTNDADLVVTGTDSSQKVGASLAAGDLDADGDEDLLVGVPGANSSAGGAWLFRALPSGSSADLDDADHELQGSYSGGSAGLSVAVLPDQDGDGLGELVVGAPEASVSGTNNGILHIWPYAPSWLDADGDGLVGAAADGPDCDDQDAAVFPGADEDSGLDSGGFADDQDCDGWIDGAYSFRLDEDLWDVDVEEALGSPTAETFDFEDASAGDDLSTHYSSNGLELTAANTVVAATSVFGADPSDSLAARIAPGTSSNSILLSFDAEIDGLAFQALDLEDSLRVQAYDASANDLLDTAGSVRVDHPGEDLAGGRFVGFVFAESVQYVRLEADLADGFGLDDLQVLWATESDRDGDGYSGADGDCDDGDADISPGEAEDLTDGVDNDCDGVVDAGSADSFEDSATWEAELSVTLDAIDFEDLTAGETVDDDYEDLGVTFSDTVEVVTDIDGASPNDTQGGQADSVVVTLEFEEAQYALAFELFDAHGSFTVDAYVGSVNVYSDTLTLSEEGTSSFHGYVYDTAIEQLVITGPSGDTWGLDDLRFAELGQDDADGDGYTEAEGDCDDDDASAYPGGTETWYDDVDGDCDGGSDYDQDGDGWDLGDDCDDTDAAVSPSETETWYDGVDSDCDGASDYDQDADGYDSEDYGGDDCDDTDATVSPGAAETYYDGIDQNCDESDEYDADGDGYSSRESGTTTEYVDEDCDDEDSSTYPGAEETYYDGEDSDCDGGSDYDADGDGYDSEDYGGLDCDDTDASVSPSATESDSSDGVDEDCDGTDEWDLDLDGHQDAALGGDDCDDTDASVSPSATEICYDGVDQDCDGDSDEYDCDGDGDDSDAYGGTDCDDTDATVHVGATEYVYDGIDSDCDGTDDYDDDGDGYQVDWYGGDDCDDTDASVNPLATETWYDGVDQDCDGGSDYDQDGDGSDSDAYGGGDCDDEDASVCPGCAEIAYDGVDQDCDGADSEDVDGDGHADVAQGGDDCDDSDASVSPSAAEIHYDGIDQNCDETDEYDADGDGQDSDAYGGDDCDDARATVYLDAPELWYDGRDQDCRGGDDYDQDGDGYQVIAWGGEDCDDVRADVNPGVEQDLCDGLDEDCDGETDEDEDCSPGQDSRSEDTAAPTDDTGQPVTDDTGEPVTDDTGTSPVDDTGTSQDSEEPVDGSGYVAPPDEGCGGCASSRSSGGSAVLGLLLLLSGCTRRRRRAHRR